MLRIFFILLALAAVSAAHPARAADLCRRDDPALKPLPAALAPAAQKLFGLQNAAPAWVAKTTVTRCMGGRLLACTYGANLPCGKANTAATLPAGADWCRQNPDSDFIPAYITGHNSIWQWRCVNGAPATTGPPAATDAQGYLSAYWKVIG